jgi:Fe-S-cluster containining protein
MYNNKNGGNIMSKSGSKKSNKNKGSRKERLSKGYKVTADKRVKKSSISLDDYLKNVYENYANLSTICNHSCECCKISMPSINYSEFVNIVTAIWDSSSDIEKLELIFTSIEYFFRYDYNKWGMDALIKPCMLLNSDGFCRYYEKRPLNCRLYGLWPKEDYESRVDKFAKAYEPLGLKREDLPLNTQCPNVKRIDSSVPITTELIKELFSKLDEIDKKIGNYSELQISQKENYRTFADWLLLKVLGEDFLVKMSQFAMAADKATMEDQMKAIREVFTNEFTVRGLPDVRKRL